MTSPHSKPILAVMLILAGSEAASGTEPPPPRLTLSEVLEIAREQSPALQRLTAQLAVNPAARRAAWGQFLPSVQTGYALEQSSFYSPTYVNPDGSVVVLPREDSVEVSPGVYRRYYVPVPEGRRRNSYAFVRLEEVLFDGGRSYYNLKASRLTEKARSEDLRAEQFRLRSEIIQRYAQTLAADHRRELSQKVLQFRRLQLELARLRFQTGSVTERDVLQAEVDLGRALTDSLSATLEWRESMDNLKTAAGLPLNTTFTLAELPPPAPVDWNADSLVQAALTWRADLESAAAAAQVNRFTLSAAKGERLPALTATWQHARSEQSGTSVPFTLQPRNRFTSASLTLSWNLFDRFTRDLRIQEARVRHRQAEISRRELAQRVEMQVRRALERLQSTYEQYRTAVAGSRLAAQTLQFEQERYRLGSASALDVGMAQVSYQQAESDRIRLEAEFHTALGALEQALNLELHR